MTTAAVLAASGSAGTTQGFKNRIINGAMVIDQRNAGASVTPTDSQYTLDRWKFGVSQTSKLTCQQNAGSVTPPLGFSNYLGITSTSAYTLAAGDYFGLYQFLEGFNTYDLQWGTANAKTVTLSFWVQSSLTGTFGGAIQNSSQTRSYPFSYSIPVANTWTQISITIAGDTTGTWTGATNGRSIFVAFGLGIGSTYGNGTAGAWVAGDKESVTGAVSIVGTSGATFYLTGIQLEVGTTATNFDFRSYGTELALCQRYYMQYGSGQELFLTSYDANTTNRVAGNLTFPVTMRTSPTITYSTNAISSLTSSDIGPAWASYIFTSSSNRQGNTTISNIIATAEL